MAALLLATLQRLEEAEIHYCLLRDGEQMEGLASQDEVDLLVAPTQLASLTSLLGDLGYAPMPSQGYAPHHFFVGYDEAHDHWVKLDLVTALTYGHPYPTLTTALAAGCLARRQRHGHGFIPSVEDELITLLLHCVLDKKRFAPHRQQRIQELRQAQPTETIMTALLQQHWQPTTQWSQLAALIDTGAWDQLLAMRATVTRHLAQQQQAGYQLRPLQQRVLRKISGWRTARRPRAISAAILAPDGAGKSTVVAGIKEGFYFPVHTAYMGLYQKSTGGLAGKLAKAGFVGRLATQWQRYLTARYQQARRKLVIFDRYTYDALLPTRKPQSRLQQWRRWALAHACPAPDLVILLDAPGEMLYARKGEHSAEFLEEQRQFYRSLQPRLRQMVIVDATQNADRVRQRVIAQIWRGYLRQNGIQADALVEKAILDLCVQE
ncbi:MAG: hypothetical protein KF832_07835 [Caldilineaceae bacterium]|nr:hypothetical protein [Caldilineaceae bacterium]